MPPGLGKPLCCTLFVVALAAGLAACGPPDFPPSAPSAFSDRYAPKIDMAAIDGRDVMDKRLRGKITVVSFFSKGCLACPRTVPALEILAREERDVAVVGVAMDAYELDARDQVTTWRLTFPVIHDKGQVLSARFKVGETPTTFLVDSVGVVRWVGGPAQTDADLRLAVDVLRERPR